MEKNLHNIVDIEKYPINDLSSSKIKDLIKKCKDELNQYSCSTISNFILPNMAGYCAPPDFFMWKKFEYITISWKISNLIYWI